MKQAALFLIHFFTLTLAAQQSEIHGIVSIHNSEYETGKRQYVQNASVEDDFEKAQSTTTFTDGTFKLIFVKVPEKTSVNLIVKKEGLQVVNMDGLSAVTGQRDVVRLSMSKPEKIAEYRRQIYKVGKTEAEKNLAIQLKKKGEQIETLQKDAQKNKTTIEQLQKEYGELQAFAAKIEEQAQDLARRYAPVNLDDAAPLYRESFGLFQKGELDKALQILRGADLVGQSNKILAEEKAIAEGRTALNKRDSIKELRKTDLMQVLGLKADLHKAKFEWDSVLFCLELRVNLDSTNVNNNTWVLADFLSEQNKKHEATYYYEKALSLAKTPALKANFLNNLGILYSDNQKMPQSEAAYTEALKIRRQLADKNPDAFLPDVAIILNNLGNYYSDNQKMQQSEAAYTEALKIYRQLANKNPDAFLPDVAMILNNLGLYYYANQKMQQSESAYTEALKIQKQLVDKNPDAFLPDAAITLNNLGNYYYVNQKMPQSEAAYTEALKIRRQLVDKNPDAFLPHVAITLNNLGVFYRTNQKMPQSEAIYTEALKIQRQLADKNPDAFLPDVAMTLNNIGVFFETLKQYDKALKHYSEAFGYREQAILRGGIHFFKDWEQVLLNISAVKDSAKVTKEYKNVVKAGQLLAEGCDKLKGINEELKPIAVSEYGSLSWNTLFIQDFSLAEKAALRCLELDNTQEYVYTNLGHSQLLREQYNQAMTTYQKLKGKKDTAGKEYKQIILDDLKELEAAGITHKYFARAKTEIEKW